MALNALVDQFCHNEKKCGTERVNAPSSAAFSRMRRRTHQSALFTLRNCLIVRCREIDLADVDTLLVVAQLHELIVAPARAVRCYTAALALRPSHIDIWLRLVGTLLLIAEYVLRLD